MITIVPIQKRLAECPNCNSTNTETKRILFPGIHVVSESVCKDCSLTFIQDLPVGHACYYPVSIDTASQKVYDPYAVDWFTKNFVHSYFNQESSAVKIERIIRKEQSDVIIINCLDYLYGHVLLKLFNVYFYKRQHPDLGLVVIVPKNYVWLVPDYVDEVWSVDLKLSQFKKWNTSLDDQFQTFVATFKTVQLAYNFPHAYTEDLPIQDFTKVSPFLIESFGEKILTATFIYRTDRLWHQNKLEYFTYLVCRKIGLLKYIDALFFYLQNKRIEKVEAILRSQYPEMTFNVAGLGKVGSFNSRINDLRVLTPDIEKELEWCRVYAESHVVIGIHGSNMLLPTGHAAAFVELLPMDRTGNLTQDIITRYKGRVALFMGRFISDRSTPALVAGQVTAIYKGWPLFNQYTSPSNHTYESDENQTFLRSIRTKIRSFLKR